MAAIASARMARAQLAQLEAGGKLDEGLRCEVLNGELVIRGSPAARHRAAVEVLSHHFSTWVCDHGGKALVDVGIEIGDQRLVPDLAFVGPDRVGDLHGDAFGLPPDLVVEVTSPGSGSIDLDEKRDVYAALGVGEYWVVDHAGERVLVRRLGDAGTYHSTEHTTGRLTTPAAPGLQVPVAELVGGDR